MPNIPALHQTNNASVGINSNRIKVDFSDLNQAKKTSEAALPSNLNSRTAKSAAHQDKNLMSKDMTPMSTQPHELINKMLKETKSRRYSSPEAMSMPIPSIDPRIEPVPTQKSSIGEGVLFKKLSSKIKQNDSEKASESKRPGSLSHSRRHSVVGPQLGPIGTNPTDKSKPFAESSNTIGLPLPRRPISRVHSIERGTETPYFSISSTQPSDSTFSSVEKSLRRITVSNSANHFFDESGRPISRMQSVVDRSDSSFVSARKSLREKSFADSSEISRSSVQSSVQSFSLQQQGHQPGDSLSGSFESAHEEFNRLRSLDTSVAQLGTKIDSSEIVSQAWTGDYEPKLENISYSSADAHSLKAIYSEKRMSKGIPSDSQTSSSDNKTPERKMCVNKGKKTMKEETYQSTIEITVDLQPEISVSFNQGQDEENRQLHSRTETAALLVENFLNTSPISRKTSVHRSDISIQGTLLDHRNLLLPIERFRMYAIGVKVFLGWFRWLARKSANHVEVSFFDQE
jgi:hypothetical protein